MSSSPTSNREKRLEVLVSSVPSLAPSPLTFPENIRAIPSSETGKTLESLYLSLRVIRVQSQSVSHQASLLSKRYVDVLGETPLGSYQ